MATSGSAFNNAHSFPVPASGPQSLQADNGPYGGAYNLGAAYTPGVAYTPYSAATPPNVNGTVEQDQSGQMVRVLEGGGNAPTTVQAPPAPIPQLYQQQNNQQPGLLNNMSGYGGAQNQELDVVRQRRLF